MNDSVLCPPNSHILSDGMISEVQQRTKSVIRMTSSTDIAASWKPDQLFDPRKRFNQYAMISTPKKHSIPVRDTYSSVPGADVPRSLLNEQRKKLEQSEILDFETGESDGSGHQMKIRAIGTTEQQVKILELLKLGRGSERKRRRDNQRRYRKKQQDFMDSLEVSNQRLRDEINQMEQRRSYVSKNGGATILHCCSTTNQPPGAFMQTTMATDVIYNAKLGSKAILSNWSMLQWFDAADVELEGLQRSSGNSLVAATITRVTITEKTLKIAFPHLCNQESGILSSPIARKLLNKRFVLSGSTRFRWDRGRCCVVSVASQSDFLTPMLQLLGTLELVALVFDKSLITPDFQRR
ncbi:hypothetical protein F441_18023 [Phytophthora nicotianae CJ01A1]|uniref:Uncharacterized protein n=2 Tax=Phytophthora nicotianae TaxID=4792 RepID=W2FYB2_PHYNI|nr:hypothetical protein L915_17676 [Phytophthora nicotianae]ETL29194.1 hypothetical protein L916_17565 [Phytophthora nicotianae]ETP05333.1 hypothetical protein F441_18023 [Phytophthora nicotianae CJ01A1]